MHSQVGGDKHVAHTLKRSEQLCLKRERERRKKTLTDYSLLEKPTQEQTSQEHKGDKTRFISTHHTPLGFILPFYFKFTEVNIITLPVA